MTFSPPMSYAEPLQFGRCEVVLIGASASLASENSR
jgi:hypothetical protein